MADQRKEERKVLDENKTLSLFTQPPEDYEYSIQVFDISKKGIGCIYRGHTPPKVGEDLLWQKVSNYKVIWVKKMDVHKYRFGIMSEKYASLLAKNVSDISEISSK